MGELDRAKRSRLPDSAFAYVDSRGRRRLPINDESHVRNALARFSQTRFENEEARETARRPLVRAARRHGIVPIGFLDGQLRSQRRLADPGRPTFTDTGYVGVAVNTVARVAAAGRGGQILVSDAVVHALGALPADVTLRGLGSYRLRAIPGGQPLHQVVAADLQSRFPPLRAASVARS